MEQTVPIINFVNNCPHEISENALEIGTRKYNQLNNEQKIIVDTVLNAARNETENSNASNCIFVNGQGGSGKTYLYETIYYILSSENINVSSMTCTGIASILQPKKNQCTKHLDWTYLYFMTLHLKLKHNRRKVKS